MTFPIFSVVLLFAVGCVCLNVSQGVIANGSNDERHRLGYFIKTLDQDDDHNRAIQNSIFSKTGKIYNSSHGIKKENISDNLFATARKTKVINYEQSMNFIERSSEESNKAIPLHITSTGKQRCQDGFVLDENGTCQKVMEPKAKSFKLRRRKRAEQPKLSYADVVKYGRNPPKHLLTTVKMEVLTTTPKPVEVKAPATKPKPSDLPKTTVQVRAGTATTIPPTLRSGISAGTPIVMSHATVKPAISDTVFKSDPVPASKPTTATVSLPKRPSRPSPVGDINQAFLSGEKSAVVAQSMDGKRLVSVEHKKPFEPTRLRRGVGSL